MNKMTLTYAGRRIRDNGRVCQCFMHGKQEFFFRNIKHVAIGHKYEGQSSGKDNLQLFRNPKKIGEVEEDDERLESWYTLDQAAEQFARDKRAALKAQRSLGGLEQLFESLHKRYTQLRTFEERDAFLNFVNRGVRVGGKK